MPAHAVTPPGATTIRVATYNLYLGADLTMVFGITSRADLGRQAQRVLDQVVANDFASRAEAVARLLAREQVDLVGLQEVARWGRAFDGAEEEVWLDFLPELLGALERAGQRYEAHACTASFRGSALVDGAEMSVLGQNVILVRRDAGITVSGEHAEEFSQALHVSTGTPEVGFDIARSWSWVDATVAGRPVRFVNTHLEAWDEAIRRRQLDELLAELEDAAMPVVLVGDLNETPERLTMPAGYVDAWIEAGSDGAGLTAGGPPDLREPGTGLSSRIDYVWAKGVGVERCAVVGAEASDRTPSGSWPSDHAGVVALIRL
jgi:endonuclease/exonuclease/phosphatase family metal-dependent hydrolase